MSDIKKALYVHLKDDAGVAAIFSTRIYPQFTTTSTQTPYIVFERSGVTTVNHMGGVATIRNESYTFICYADTQLEIEQGKEAVQDALDGLRRTTASGVVFDGAFETSESDDFDARGMADENPAYNEIVTYNFWVRL